LEQRENRLRATGSVVQASGILFTCSRRSYHAQGLVAATAFGFAKPDDDTAGPAIDLCHQPDLSGSLNQVSLVDADGINPHDSLESAAPKAKQRCV
jgi:hypothetical protein